MRYLVDTNVLSEATKPSPDLFVLGWLRKHEHELSVDPLILGELHFGILLLPAGRRRDRLEKWFQSGVSRLDCLSWNAATGLRWARLLADLRASGQTMPVKDSLIAATALAHGLAVATRNTRDFAKTGVRMVNPFEDTGR
ncbi:MAG: type II toxin-antitoxin system VapC family toxin [Kiritimatiellae bacterium]|nr:type II toxin-antitoxin system VapC family toxin [Kiritimatiellia bacterium]MDD4622818.1 type II toxin-antitoxin system VapC family toxin [Kiritimatiellia bacterium]